MNLASIAATLPASKNAHAAQPSAAEAPDGDFDSVLASYAPANDAARTAVTPVKAVQVSSTNEAQKPALKEIKPVKGIVAVADAAKLPKLSAKADTIAKTSKTGKENTSSKAADANADADASEPDSAPLAIAPAVAPQVQAANQIPLVIAAGSLAQQAVAQELDAATNDEAAGESPAVKFGSAAKPDIRVSADPSAGREQDPIAAHEQGALQEKQANAPQTQSVDAAQMKAANPVSNQAMDAIAAAVKSQIQKPEMAPSAPLPAPHAGIGSITAMLNAVRGTITAIVTPKQAAMPQADSKASPKNAVKIDANPPMDVRVTELESDMKNVAKDDVEPAANALVADREPDTKNSVRANVETAATARVADQTPDTKNAVKADVAAAATARAADQKADANNTVKPEIKAAPAPLAAGQKPAAAQVRQDDDAQDATAKIGQQSSQDATRDQASSIVDRVAKPEVAAPAPAAQPAAQVPAPATVIAPAMTQDIAVNLASASANGSEKAVPSNTRTSVQPNISALATAIAAKSSAGTKTFDIRMDPPELGRVDVHLSVDCDGKVQALLSAEHPQTLELLQRDSQNLERALKDAGLNLSNNSLNFSLKGEQRQGDGGGASMARARSLPDAVVARAEAANASEINFSAMRGNGRLDIRV